MTADDPIRLLSGALEVLIAPQIGGSIKRFDHLSPTGLRTPVLRGTDKLEFHIEESASLPLVPYCNRIRNGSFDFRGREVRISRNKPTDASPLHGDGWLASWLVERATSREAQLSYRHEAGEWPWTYEARQDFSLDAGGLSLRITCRNLSGEAMPCGLGQHPFYPCDPETRLSTRVADVWTIDDKVLPVEKVPAEGRYDMNDRLVCGQGLDNGFDQWSGEARIHTPGRPFDVVLTSSDAQFFQFYSPLEQGFFVAEPVSHANAALNEPEDSWAELGLRVLSPGEEMSLNARFDVVPQA